MEAIRYYPLLSIYILSISGNHALGKCWPSGPPCRTQGILDIEGVFSRFNWPRLPQALEVSVLR